MEKASTLKNKSFENTFDVVVVGGGLSGLFAAIAAARENKKVILIEKSGCLGGMATNGLINPFMNYCEHGSQKIANGGLFQLLLKKMYNAGAIVSLQSRTFREQILKCVLDEFAAQYGVKVLFHSYMYSVTSADGTIQSVCVGSVSGTFEIRGKYFIDATGDGNLFAFAGMKYYLRKGPKQYSQPMSTCFNLTEVDWKKFDNKKANELYRAFKAEGKIKNPRENILVFDSPIESLMHFNTTRIVKKNPCDVEDLTAAEIIGRKQIVEIYNFLKQNIDGFQKSELVCIANEVGVRESRRVKGLYKLTESDVLSARKFSDRIARGTYDVDIHNPTGEGTTIKHIPENDYYTVPYRSMIPEKSKNLLVAGRAICCSHEAHSSVRVMPITSCIGEAAGIAAALACEENVAVSEISIKKLHRKMDKYEILY